MNASRRKRIAKNPKNLSAGASSSNPPKNAEMKAPYSWRPPKAIEAPISKRNGIKSKNREEKK